MTTKKTTSKAKPTVAMLAKDESVISEEMANKYRKYVKELEEKQRQENLIKSGEPKGGGKGPGSIYAAGDDAIGSAGADRAKRPSAKAGPKKPTVAIYSDRNVSWIGVGKVSKGYNIVTKEQAEKWLTRNHVREATPEEVASQFGV
jgi:hypothetical protein